MDNGLSAADVMALTKDNGMADWCNNPFIYLVWLALLGGGGIFGGWGGGYGGNSPSVEGSLTRSALYEANNSQDMFRNFGEIASELSNFERVATDSWGNIRYDMLDGFCGLGQQIAENRYAQQLANCGIERNIDSVKAEAYKNTCEITSAIHGEAEATRALITQNTIQDLRDRLEERDRALQAANFQISQQQQTADLIDTLRPISRPAYLTTSPYASINPYGYTSNCGCGCGNTVI